MRFTRRGALWRVGGTLENTQEMAAHESPRTTKLYDRTGDEITLDEVVDLDAALCGLRSFRQRCDDYTDDGNSIPNNFLCRDKIAKKENAH